MKTIITLLTVIACAFLLTGCPEDIVPCQCEDYSVVVTIPFSSEFTTSFSKSTLPAGSYKDLQDPVCQLIQTGNGMDESIGYFDLYLNCCWSSVDGEHVSTECYISDADGDVLYMICKETEDAITFSQDYPYDQTIMCSEFEFAGGTGKFTCATGSVNMECRLKDAAASYIEHTWEGSLTMVLGF
jgi:hypothetical protein